MRLWAWTSPPDTKFGLSQEMKKIPPCLRPPKGLTSHKKSEGKFILTISNFAQTLATFALKMKMLNDNLSLNLVFWDIMTKTCFCV